ncbi:hypothetical protein GA0070216_1358 [Micromonospora matsumotoense]|uniref:Uncharacterized protein n=2 Tax=Micromonospora matsumotoense TaxID=121616 RepID=A0A1C5AWD0_9ACTN|nr:hypothetical protein GA0070216_1358 [Micromonospora matsumotoense]
MSNKNPKAKRLAAAYGLRYAEALGVIREDSDLTEELAEELEISRAEAERRIEEQYAAARQRADEQGVSFRTALAEIRAEQFRRIQHEALAKAEPSIEDLLREAIQSHCNNQMAGEPIEVEGEGEDNLHVSGLNFNEVELPRERVDEIGVQAIDPDFDTLIWDSAEAYDGTTEVGTAEVRASVTFDGFMLKAATYGEHEVTVTDFDWNDHVSYVGFEREVVLTFQVTVQDRSIDSIEFMGATEGQPVPDVHYRR